MLAMRGCRFGCCAPMDRGIVPGEWKRFRMHILYGKNDELRSGYEEDDDGNLAF